ncbi:MAG TPA: hypothetical protein VFE62_09765 [Gemmataceae bacterium]|nr:hypothetical protein [Gemmataceae bacterium]
MMRSLLASFALCACLCTARSAPARLRYEPALPPFLLVGTRWSGSDIESGEWQIVFEKDGTVTYSYNGRTFRNGTWKWHKDVLYFETNQRFYEFRGTFHGDCIDGESSNIRGIRWHTSMYRVQGQANSSRK